MKKIILLLTVLGAALFLGACNNDDKDGFDTSQTIGIYTRDTASGTRDGFMGAIGFSDAKTDNSILADGFIEADNAQILNAAKTNEYAIGYVSLSSLTDDVKALNFAGVEATEANVNNGTYKLSRNFNYMLRDTFANETEEQISKAFVAYLGTTNGMAAIEGEGGIVDTSGASTWNSIKDTHAVCSQDNSGVTIKFGGSNSVSKVAQAVANDFKTKCGNFVNEHEHTGSSDGYKRTNGSEKDGANAIHIGFASREFKDTETATVTGKLATDAIVAIVHKNNTLENVTAADLKDMYSGAKTKWEEITQ